ncbi:MAG: DUF1638 domain-containing protein [Chloroflexi bacterium]|nr:DUF1638 domain-containing protein [Chloroflexota bacterium]
MRLAVIACQTVESELRPLLPPDTAFVVVEQGLHRTPDRLRECLQKEIDALDVDEILLGYGLCGNGVAGLRSSRARLVVPRVDDCISLLLGSLQRYREEFEREPGTYWFSQGWIDHSQDPFKEYQRCIGKYGEETARWVAREMMKGYHRTALIDTGVCPVSRLREYARQFADFFSLDYDEVAGSDDLLRELVSPERQDHHFVVVEPGEAITPDMFLSVLSTING